MINAIKTQLVKHKQISIPVAIVTIILCMSVVGILSNSAKEVSYPEVVTISNDNPDETPLDDYEWKGGLDDPKYIQINTINAGGFIQKVDVDQRQEVGVPSNVALAGWFIKSVKPGDKGLSIIDGHVDGRSKPGIFKSLEQLNSGDKFTVEFGDGEKRSFEVTGKTKVSDQEAPAVLFSQDQGESQLNLITCGGTYDQEQRRYRDRIIVTSIPIL